MCYYSTMNISITNLKRKMNFKRVTWWLATQDWVTVTHDGDPVCEIHPPGTSDRLAALDQALGEMSDAEAGSIFRVLEDGSLKLLAEGG